MLNLAARARPYFGAIVLSTILLTAGGIYSMTRMPSGVYPEVTFPRIAVVARKPGLDLRNMELQVTQPLEEAVSTVIGVARVRSKTIRGGSELSSTSRPAPTCDGPSSSPGTASAPPTPSCRPTWRSTVEQMTPSVFPILSVVLTGGDSPAQLRDYAFYQLRAADQEHPRRAVLPTSPAATSARSKSIAGPTTCWRHGLSAADLADQIGQAAPPPARRPHREPAVRLSDASSTPRARTAEQIEELVISTHERPAAARPRRGRREGHRTRTATLSIGFDRRGRRGHHRLPPARAATRSTSRNDIRDGLARPANRCRRGHPGDGGLRSGHFVDTAVDNVRDAIIDRRPVQRPDPAGVPAQLAGDADLGPGDSDHAGHHLPVPALERRNAQPDVAGRPGRRHRPDHRRHRRGHREHRPPPAASKRRERRRTAAPAWRSRSRHAIDAASGEITGAVVGSTLTTVLVFVPLAFIVGVYGQFFAAAELVAVDRRAGVDGHQPDAGAGVRGQVPGGPADAGAGPDLQLLRRRLRVGCCAWPCAVPWVTLAPVAGGGRRRRRSLHRHSQSPVPSTRPGKPPPIRWSRDWKPV